ncbi:sigma-70 RNA polymerase sigma factor region 4 domain-containing protein [Streptomyces daliensis]|uniref:Sigma-70 family RNA polymerase sigma factor n=1 Tax=Streptomyces daliensis TaxID=299421 RepID=A0A8T4IU90_9ACTN|nr:sigma-70 family RNA polymerase sigma factor [Streptomyces daliensis]
MLALLAAECAAEAAGGGVEPEDLQQGVWLRWLEGTRGGGPPPRGAADWLRAAVREEARTARARRAAEVPLGDGEHASYRARAPWGRTALVVADDGVDDAASDPEAPLLAAERRHTLRAAIGRLPGPCPALFTALLSRRDPTYPEIARELGMSQGSLGPVRSRCLGCLRRMLTAEVAAHEPRGMVR